MLWHRAIVAPVPVDVATELESRRPRDAVAAFAADPVGDTRTAGATMHSAKRHVLVVYERGRGGEAALAEGAGLVASSAAVLTVVTLAPQDTNPGCTVYSDAYNAGVREQAGAELGEARRLLGAVGGQARYQRLVEGRDPPLEKWVAASAFDLVLLPARRLPYGPRHGTARRLRRSGDCEVRVAARP